MICSVCQTENDSSAKFCAECGNKLQVTCPNCGAQVSPSANFCSSCGHALKQSGGIEKALPESAPDRRTERPADYTPSYLAKKILRDRKTLEGERRTVTVLFIDAVGSTAIGEQLDPEVLYGLTQEILGYMLDAVFLYEGTVSQFRGDGILAVFGAPIAHEDAARRAVAAGLEMQRTLGEFAQEVEQRLGIDLRFRVGLNSGRVVVGRIGDDLDMEFAALGDTTNLGARMEGAAEPGTVYITEATYKAVQDYFEIEYAGQISAKGKSEPVEAYQVIGERPVRTRLEATADRGLSSYIGRDYEFDTLTRCLDQVDHGRGQVVFISGEAGIGKSRLLFEFHCSTEGTAAWFEGQCISFGKHIPYSPLIDIIKQAFSITEGDSETGIIRRINEGTAGWNETVRATIPFIKVLLSVDPGDPTILAMDPRERRAGIQDALRALLIEGSRNQPLVIVIEDIHWLDEQSEIALQALVDIIAPLKVLLLLTFRPGYSHSFGERSYFDHLKLGDLPPEQSEKLVRAVLRESEMPDQLLSLITKKGEGNPLYIEEVTKSLLETGVLREVEGKFQLAHSIETLLIPNTIQEIILSRVDRLESETKAALQLASVIGREFTARLLEHISDLEDELEQVLGELKVLELIYQEAYFPELVYMFKHALTQDVTYRTLLRKRRKSLHRIIGAAIEELYAQRITEQVEVLAHHYSKGEAWEKALPYLVDAGDKAAVAFANHDALDYYARAIEVCAMLGPSSTESVVDIAAKRGDVNFTISKYTEAMADFNRMHDAAVELNDAALEGLALIKHGEAAAENHDPVTAESDLRKALEGPGREVNNIRFHASVFLALIMKVYGRHNEAKPLYDSTAELVPRIDDPHLLKLWAKVGTIFLTWEGRFEEALSFSDLVDGGSDIRTGAADLTLPWRRTLAFIGKGAYQQALDSLTQIIFESERQGSLMNNAKALNTLGWLYGEIQDFHQAIEWNKRGIAAAEKAGFPDPEIENNARLNLADNLLALGRLDEAEEQFSKIGQIIHNPQPLEYFQLWRYSQHYFHSYGELWLARGELQKALSYADECLALAEETDSRKYIVKGRRLRGQVFIAQDHLEEAEEELSTALDLAQKVGNPTQLWKTFAALGDLYALCERSDDARHAYNDALAIIEDVAVNLDDPEQRETLLTAAAVQEISMKSEKA